MAPSTLTRGLHRALALTHRQVLRLDRALAKLAVALHTPALKRLAADAHYAATTVYRTPGDQRRGLYPFERRALDTHFHRRPPACSCPAPAAAARSSPSSARGYQVDAFEPVPPLVDAANRALAEGGAAARVTRSTLEQWSAAPPAAAPYDGIFTGWATWTHLIQREARLAALRAFRRACPRGPVLLSFWRREPVFDSDERDADAPPEPPPPGSRAARWEAMTRGVVRGKLLRLPPVEPGTTWRAGLFVHCVSEHELPGRGGGGRVRRRPLRTQWLPVPKCNPDAAPLTPMSTFPWKT